MRRYRFALRPRWILSHLLILLLVVVMVNLGFWQLRRLHSRKEFNATVRSAEAAPVVALDSLAVKAPDYRRVKVTGTYDIGREVLVRGRSFDEAPGAWVLTPLKLDDGHAVIVNRGWIPTEGVPDHVPKEVEPPRGTVTVTGLLMPTQTRGRFGPRDPTTGTLTDLARADIGRIQQQVPYDLYRDYVQVGDQSPKQPGDFPRPLPAPELDEGPHLSYAIQWFIFSTIAVVGYPMILRRRARQGDPPAPPTSAGTVL
jgi:surfeit locus 1 family protein